MSGLDCTTRDVWERVSCHHPMVILLVQQTALDASFLLTHEMALLFECGKVILSLSVSLQRSLLLTFCMHAGVAVAVQASVQN